MNSVSLILPSLLVLAGIAEAILLVLLLRSGWALRIAADIPNDRSLHASATPRIGGLVMMPLALLPAAILLPGMRLLALAGLALWLLSFIDDRRGLPVVLRLLAQSAAAWIVVARLDPAPALIPAATFLLLLIWGANLYNFMDGADGLAGGMAASGFLVFGLASWNGAPELAILCFLLATTALAFLLFNFAPAKIFLGDAGAVPLGFLAAALGLLGWQWHIWPSWFPVLVFSPFILDASVTLLKRLLRRERIWQAHREHYYQRLVRMGWSHRRLALMEYALMSACGASALLLLNCPASVKYIGLLAWVSIYAMAMIMVDLCWQKHQRNTI